MGGKKDDKKRDEAPRRAGGDHKLFDDDGLARKWAQSDMPEEGAAAVGSQKDREYYKMLRGNKKEKGKNDKGASKTVDYDCW